MVIKIIKSHFRFYHPKFSKMTRSIWIFCTESRSKSINTAQSGCQSFCFKLTWNCKTCFFTKEIFWIINNFMSIFNFHSTDTGFHTHFCNFFHAQSCDLEHFACTFTIWTSNFRSINILESSFLEKWMNGKCHLISHAINCSKSICSRTQMCIFAKIFHGHFIFLQRIFIWITNTKTF